MTVTPMNRGDVLNVELWSSQLRFVEMMKRFQFGHMAARGILARADELDRAEAGDKITIEQIGRLTGTGIGEGGTLEGNEEGLNQQGFSMVFNTFRHAVAYYGKSTSQGMRSRVKYQERAEEVLRNFHGSRLDASCFNQLAGVNSTTIEVEGTVYSGASRTFVQGLNAISAPSINRIIRAGAAANDQSITSSDTMTLDLIDVALEKLQTTQPTAEPLDGNEFDLFLSHQQALDLRRDTSGSIQWYTNYLAATEGGMITDNPIMQGSAYGTKPIGKYQNVNIYTSNNVATGVSSADNSAISTVRRAVLCGKGALLFSSKFSGALTGDETIGGKAPLEFFREERDFQYVEATEGRMIYGVKKQTFESEDLNVIVISTYGASHTA
jgi:hypothetical protein